MDGKPMDRIARELGVRRNSVFEWRKRLAKLGVSGLRDRPRSGKPVAYGAECRKLVVELLVTPPPMGQASWDGPAVAKGLKVSDDAGWRLLRNEGICLSRQRSWCVRTDTEFAAKTADVVGLYLNRPEIARVISVDV